MYTQEEILGYKIYLEIIEKRMLNKYFENQKPYLCCKKGCSYCCEKGEFPTTEIEMQYLYYGFMFLSDDVKKNIHEKITKLKELKKQHSVEKELLYECPFLINNACCLYEYRPIICRTHGLMFFLTDKNGNLHKKIPYCVNLGLNYANVYDTEQKIITTEKWQQSGIKVEPNAFNISRKILESKDLTEPLGFIFGEDKRMIDWL